MLSLEELLARGWEHVGDGRLEEVIPLYDDDLLYHLNDPQLFYLRGQAYNHTGQFDRAITDLSVAIELDPDFEGNYFNRGISLYYTARYEDAIRNFTKAMDLSLFLSEPYFFRGMCHLHRQEYDLAVSDLAAATKGFDLGNNKALYYTHLHAMDRYKTGMAPITVEKERLDLEIRGYNKNVRMYWDERADYFFNRGGILKELGAYHRSLADLTLADELAEGKNAFYILWKAMVLDLLGEYKRRSMNVPGLWTMLRNTSWICFIIKEPLPISTTDNWTKLFRTY